MLIRVISGLAVTAVLAACGTASDSEQGTTGAEAAEAVVNVYSSRHYDTDLALYEDFTAATGIRVNRIEAGADELIARIQSEGEFSPADLLITVDAGRLWRAEEAGIFEPIESDTLTGRIPESLRHPDGAWFGPDKASNNEDINQLLDRVIALFEESYMADYRGMIQKIAVASWE